MISFISHDTSYNCFEHMLHLAVSYVYGWKAKYTDSVRDFWTENTQNEIFYLHCLLIHIHFCLFIIADSQRKIGEIDWQWEGICLNIFLQAI